MYLVIVPEEGMNKCLLTNRHIIHTKLSQLTYAEHRQIHFTQLAQNVTLDRVHFTAKLVIT